MKNEMSKYMQEKADQIALAAEQAAEYITDWQQLRLFLLNRITEVELSAGQQEKLKRYNIIFSEMSGNKYEDHELPALISTMFNISESQAYRDIAATKELWSKVIKLDKLFEIRLSIEGCKRMLRKAEELNDIKGYAMIDKNLQKYKDMLPDEEESMTDGWQPPSIDATFDPTLIGMPAVIDMKALLEKINEKRNAKLNMDMIEEAIVIEEKHAENNNTED